MTKGLRNTLFLIVAFAILSVGSYGIAAEVVINSSSSQVEAGCKGNAKCRADKKKKKKEENKKAKKKEKKKKEDHQKKLDDKKKAKQALKLACHVNTKYPAGDKRRCYITGGSGTNTKCTDGAKSVTAMCGGSNCSSVIAADCSNANTYCVPNDGCSCTSTSCKPGTPASKFRQNPVGNGSHVVCTGCLATTIACPAIYTNSVPTCNIAPKAISTTRTAGPKSFTMNVSDKDYGDTVKVVGVKVVDSSGNLKSCVNVTTLNGGSVDNMVVKTGANKATDITQKTTFMVDARSAYGVYDSIGGGISQCSGDLVIELADVDSDGNGLDRSDHTTCKVSVSVTNDNPTISNIRVEDRDANPTLRRSGNLVPQYAGPANNLPVGSLFDARRVASCSSAVNITGDVGECNNWIPQKTRTNPYSISFRVTDNEGLKDIKDIGFWIQRGDSPASIKVPLTKGNARQSIQGLIGQRKDYKIPANGGGNYFTAAPCIGSICSRNITSESLLSYALVTDRGGKVNTNGNISVSQRWSSDYKEWLKKGFPNCLFTTSGCNAANIPAASKNKVTSDASKFYNYDWMIAADRSHMMCLSSSSNSSTVIPTSAICPSSCAACVALEELDPVAGDPNSVNVRFLVAMNDRFIQGGAGPGMEEGRYEVFIGARDTVSGLAYNNSFWNRIGGSANTFTLMFDAQPPTVLSFGVSQEGEAIRAFGTIEDTKNQSTGLSGWGTRYLIKEKYIGAQDLSGELSFLSKVIGSTTNLWNGANDFIDNIPLNNQGQHVFEYTGHGISLTENALVSAGLCTYDNAGNMCCTQTVAVDGTSKITKSCANYADLGALKTNAPWVQAAVGSVYSNASGAAFDMTVPNTSTSNLDSADKGKVSGSYAPFNVQSGSAVSGILVSGGSSAGLVGGREFNNQQYALGFSATSNGVGNYRTTSGSDNGNAFNIETSENRNWYGILYSSTALNCELSSDCTAPETGLASVGTTSGQSYIVVSNSVTLETPLVCKGANIIFITGSAEVAIAEVHKADVNSGCMFVVDDGATLKVIDPSFKTLGSEGIPGVDRFEAAVVVSEGGTFITENRESLRNVIFDRLQIKGFLYSETLPQLDRTLRPEDNEEYPAEWFVYDACLLDVFRNMLGLNKTVDLVSGTSDHILTKVVADQKITLAVPTPIETSTDEDSLIEKQETLPPTPERDCSVNKDGESYGCAYVKAQINNTGKCNEEITYYKLYILGNTESSLISSIAEPQIIQSNARMLPREQLMEITQKIEFNNNGYYPVYLGIEGYDSNDRLLTPKVDPLQTFGDHLRLTKTTESNDYANSFMAESNSALDDAIREGILKTKYSLTKDKANSISASFNCVESDVKYVKDPITPPNRMCASTESNYCANLTLNIKNTGKCDARITSYKASVYGNDLRLRSGLTKVQIGAPQTTDGFASRYLTIASNLPVKIGTSKLLVAPNTLSRNIISSSYKGNYPVNVSIQGYDKSGKVVSQKKSWIASESVNTGYSLAPDKIVNINTSFDCIEESEYIAPTKTPVPTPTVRADDCSSSEYCLEVSAQVINTGKCNKNIGNYRLQVTSKVPQEGSQITFNPKGNSYLGIGGRNKISYSLSYSLAANSYPSLYSSRKLNSIPIEIGYVAYSENVINYIAPIKDHYWDCNKIRESLSVASSQKLKSSYSEIMTAYRKCVASTSMKETSLGFLPEKIKTTSSAYVKLKSGTLSKGVTGEYSVSFNCK